MSSPEADEVLFAYVAVAPHAVSLVLIRDDNGVQRPVYYVSKSLHEAEARYLPLEKSNSGDSTRHTKAPSLLSSAYGHRSNSAPPSSGASKRRLHRKDHHVECAFGGL